MKGYVERTVAKAKAVWFPGKETHHRGLLALTASCMYCQSFTCVFQGHFLSVCHWHDAGLPGRQRYSRKDPYPEMLCLEGEIALGQTVGWTQAEDRHCSLAASRYQRDRLVEISVITIY